MLNQQTIKDFLADLTSRGMSQNTIRAYKADLEGLQQWIALDSISPNKTLEQWAASYLNFGRAQWAPKTTCRKLTTFRAFALWLGMPTMLANYKPPVPARAQPHPIPEGVAGVEAMIARTRNPLHKALLALNGLMGLRIDECVNITPDCFDLNAMTLKVRGKGDKTRVIPIGDKAWKHLVDQYTFAAEIDPGQRLVPYSNRGARAAITRHGRNAGLSRHVASHDLRATAITAGYNKSKDLRAMQEFAGHADPKTTMLYTGVEMAAMRDAVNF